MATEDIDPRFADLDLWATKEALEALYDSQRAAVDAVRAALPAIGAAVDAALAPLRRGGRLI